ncbi:HNH endonuclease [Sphingobacterium sp. SGL-16]|uniref:HNH endonuclease n=1 Tax=Sphingobacterium sp. SGL-16 TaxID=2710883 RepID=UPI0013ED023A|nr:HNH endonuclease [Sphingobacterium sp. SGL-16]NGM71683.1 restriction endonuclease [Sphingobacterium sp. SGL-16]
MINLDQLLQAISRIKRGGTKYGKAPHKAILLLTLIELIDKGVVTDNHFRINSDLVGLFQENWRLLVSTSHQTDFTQPFYYMQSNKIAGNNFWEVITYNRAGLHAHVKSVETLSRLVEYAVLSNDVFASLLHVENRLIITNYILTYFFPETQSYYLAQKGSDESYYSSIQQLVLNDPEVKYKRIEILSEEDVFVLSHLFKRYIPQVYNDTCAVTGMQIRSTFNYNFVDACHIVPFSVSHDDKVTNGLALCPNVHRAFDRGLIAVNDNYQILVSKAIKDNLDHPYSFSQLEKRQLILPQHDQHYPSLENLAWHRREVFKR